MFKLSDLYEKFIRKPLPTDCGVTCEMVDPHMAKLNRLITETVSCFSYTLILSGSQTVDYGSKQTVLQVGDIFISTPGMRVYTKEVSDDYSAICLMGDETVTYEIPYARNVITASYFPSVSYSENKLTLKGSEPAWLERRLRDIIAYIDSDHIFKKECIYSLYSLFILDLLHVESRLNKSDELNGHTIDIYLRFMRLLTENFKTRHDIAFYSDSLSVTSVYLSRVVKRFSGQTVKNHVDRLLIMEAAYLLASTDLPIAVLAEKLNFANPSSFSKFFTKHKGISPREYRNTRPINS